MNMMAVREEERLTEGEGWRVAGLKSIKEKKDTKQKSLLRGLQSWK